MKTITNYTPGPWEFVPGTESNGHHNNDYLGSIQQAGTDGDFYEVAAIWADLYTKNECEANAELIALAPTLYEENKRLREVFGRLVLVNRNLKRSPAYAGYHQALDGLINEAAALLTPTPQP